MAVIGCLRQAHLRGDGGKRCSETFCWKFFQIFLVGDVQSIDSNHRYFHVVYTHICMFIMFLFQSFVFLLEIGKTRQHYVVFFWVHDRDFKRRPQAKQWLYKGILQKWHHLISYMFQQKSEPPFAYTYSLFQISDASPCHFKGKRGTCFFFNPHELDDFGLRWIVFTKVRALSCGQWVSQLHLLQKMAGIFRNSSIESSDPSSSCSKNSLKYGSVCACVFLLHWNFKNSWNRSMILLLLQEFGRQVNSKPATKIPDMFYLMLTESDEKIGECVLF